jgi:hypothetical protein
MKINKRKEFRNELENNRLYPMSVHIPFPNFMIVVGKCSKWKLIYDWQSVSQSVLVSGTHPSGTCDQSFFLLEISFRQFWVCCFVAPSLTRGRVRNLRLLLCLARAVTLGSKSRRTQRPYFIVSSETPPTCRARFPYLYSPGTGWPSYTPGHWVPFCHLLWLAGLRWRYSNPPPHGSLGKCCLIQINLY